MPSPPTIPRAAIPPQATTQRQPDGCRYLLTQVTEEACRECQGNVRIRVYGCQRHCLCTLAKPLLGKACCATRPDYSSA
jgi:hypothetical protein